MTSHPAAGGSHVDQRQQLREFASGRRYVVGRDELLERGFLASSIKSWLKTGRLVPLFGGVYAYGRDIETRESAWRAGLLVGGPGAVLTGRSALEAWGVVRSAGSVPRWIHVATASRRTAIHVGRSPSLCGTRVNVMFRKLEPEDIRRKNGLQLVRPPLALIDFCLNASPKEVLFAFLEMCRLGLFRRVDVDFTFDRARGRRGTTKLKPLLAMWVPELNRIRSVLEGMFLLAWMDRGLLMPRINQRIFGREVDCFWPDHGLVLELDGGAFHSDPIARKRDAEKMRFLQGKGLEVIRVTWAEFEAHPDSVVDRVARSLT